MFCKQFGRWLAERPWTRGPGVAVFILLLPIGVAMLVLYQAIGTAANIIFVLAAVVGIGVVIHFTIQWWGAGWILLTVPVSFGLLVPAMITMAKLNRRAGFD